MSTEETTVYQRDYDLPPLSSGAYTISVTQKVGQREGAYRSTGHFTIAGERFQIQREEIGGVYPPKNGLGDYDGVAPHLVLNRSTLPWERKPQVNDDTHAPWMGLLLLYEDELKRAGGIRTVTLSSLMNGTTEGEEYKWHFPPVDLEPGQSEKDLVQVIDITRDDFGPILNPSLSELNNQAHVRELFESDKPVAKAYLLSNRPIEKDKVHQVILVSLEHRYENGTFRGLQDVGDGDRIRLVVLYSWSFTCSQAGGGFSDVMRGLSMEPFTCPAPTTADASSSAVQAAQPLLSSGYSPVPHLIRQGGQSLSWYRGPLAPSTNQDGERLIATKSSDIWLKYHKQLGMIDVSYAAAWDLGRLLALRNVSYSESLYRWKRAYARNKHFHDQHHRHDTFHLKVKPDTNEVPMPEPVENYLMQLAMLQEIPFQYLVPQETMLPEQSIRFIQLDALWVYALLDGAMSIGRVSASGQEIEKEIVERHQFQYEKTVSGFLLRSEAVTNWPEFQVKGIAHSTPLTILRREKLSAQVMICLFDGAVDQVDLFLDSNQMHFERRNGETQQVAGEGISLII